MLVAPPLDELELPPDELELLLDELEPPLEELEPLLVEPDPLLDELRPPLEELELLLEELEPLLDEVELPPEELELPPEEPELLPVDWGPVTCTMEPPSAPAVPHAARRALESTIKALQPAADVRITCSMDISSGAQYRSGFGQHKVSQCYDRCLHTPTQ